MSINLSSLKNIESKGSIDTSIGKLYLFWLSMRDTEILSEYFKDGYRDKDELVTIKRLITLAFYPDSSLREGKYKPDCKVLTLEDIDKLTNKEIEVLAELYIDQNPSLYMKDKKIVHPIEENESNIQYLYRLLSIKNEKYLKSIEDLKKSMSLFGGFSPNLEKAVLGNIVSSKKLAETIGQASVQNLVMQSTELREVQDSFKNFTLSQSNIVNASKPVDEILSAISDLGGMSKLPILDFKTLNITVDRNVIDILNQFRVNKIVLPKLDMISAQSIFKNNIASVNFIKVLSKVNLASISNEYIARNSINQLNKDFLGTRNIVDYYEKITGLASFNAILRFNDFSVGNVFDKNYEDSLYTVNALSKTIVEIDDEISDELFSVNSYRELSDDTRNKLSYIYDTYILPLIFLFLGVPINILVTPHVSLFLQDIKLVKTKQEVKSIVRRSPPVFDREALKGYRVTIADNLNLCSDYEMDSDVIEVLPIGTIVKVIDKSNRSWLKVEVEINGELEQGWILRRYTTYFK